MPQWRVPCTFSFRIVFSSLLPQVGWCFDISAYVRVQPINHPMTYSSDPELLASSPDSWHYSSDPNKFGEARIIIWMFELFFGWICLARILSQFRILLLERLLLLLYSSHQPIGPQPYPVIYVVANPVRGHKEVPRSTGHTMVTTRYSDQQGSKSRQTIMRLYKRWHRPITNKRFIKPLLLHIESSLDRLRLLSPTHDQRSQQQIGQRRSNQF